MDQLASSCDANNQLALAFAQIWVSSSQSISSCSTYANFKALPPILTCCWPESEPEPFCIILSSPPPPSPRLAASSHKLLKSVGYKAAIHIEPCQCCPTTCKRCWNGIVLMAHKTFSQVMRIKALLCRILKKTVKQVNNGLRLEWCPHSMSDRYCWGNLHCFQKH
jgi:hypothetical protein